jgi:type I restriction enzyme S subunit
MKFRWETEFKETEIGEIPMDWERSEIGSFMVIKSGKRPKEIKVYGFYEVWGANGFMGYTDATDYLENREILITGRVGTLGNVYYIKKNSNVWLSDNVLILYPNDHGISLKFVFYHLLTRKEDIISLDVGSTQPLITQNGLKNLIIPLPPLSEQSRIATVLSWFDDLIENKERQNEILEKTAMAIFKSWFIDFEPFRDEEFVYNEELGKEIPKGWEVKRLGEVVKTFKGISYKSSEKYQEYIEEGYIFITLDNFVRGGGFKNEYSWIKSERIKPSHLVKEGDLIIALTDMTQNAQVVGSPAIVILPNGFDVGVISLDCMKLEPVVENLKYYLYMFLKNTQEDNSTFANGVNVLHLMVNNFLNGKILFLPPSHILQSFHSLVEPLFEKIILNQKQIMTLKKVRDTFLLLLVFGKLRVEEI